MLAPWAAGPAIAENSNYHLTAESTRIQLAGAPFPETETWSFNQQSPGPLLRLRQGQPAAIGATNRLSQGITVHWHDGGNSRQLNLTA